MSTTGRIELIIGCMFSGKTTEMIRRINRHHYGNFPKKTTILKWDRDYRGGEIGQKARIDTHDGMSSKCLRIDNKLTQDGKLIKELYEKLKDCDVIGIDEGHFFPEKDDLVTFCDIMANEHGKYIIVSALDSNFLRGAFDEVIKLVPKCETVTKLTAVCQICSKDAHFTKKLSKSTKLIEVGGAELYIPVCRNCYNNNNNNSSYSL